MLTTDEKNRALVRGGLTDEPALAGDVQQVLRSDNPVRWRAQYAAVMIAGHVSTGVSV